MSVLAEGDGGSTVRIRVVNLFKSPLSAGDQTLKFVDINVNTMGTSQIRVSEEAKARLEAMKREGESYADVVERLLEERDDADWRDAAGLWSDDKADYVREQLDESREKRKQDLRRSSD